MKSAQKLTESNKKLKRSQLQALPVLATSPNYSQAARTLGISTERIYAWLKDSLFCEELNKLRDEIVEDSIAKMKGYTTKAVDVLGSLLEHSNATIRLRASNALIGHVSKFIELQEMERRLLQLEQRYQEVEGKR